jgi:hypothetical protein
MKFKKSASTEKLKKLVSRQRLQTLFTFALGALLLFQMVQFYQFRQRLAFIDDLYDRNANVLTDLNKGKEYLSNFGADLNQIRQFLLLPTKSYDFSDMDTVDLASDESGADLNTELFDFVGSLGKYEQNEALYAANLTAVKTGITDPAWAASGLTLVSADGQASEDRMEFSFTDASLGGATVLKVDLSYDGLFSVPLYYREVNLTDRSSWSSVFADVQSFLTNDLAALRTSVHTANSAELDQVLKDKEMALSGEQEDEETFFYQLRNSQLAALGAFSISKQDGGMEFSLDTAVDGSFDPLTLNGTASADLLAALRDKVDARTDTQKKLDEKKAEMEGIMADRAFVATLDKLGLHFGPITETDAQVQYPLLDAAGATLRILFIDKSTMEVKVMLPDGQEVQSLSMATEDLNTSGKKKAWICLIPYPVTLG